MPKARDYHLTEAELVSIEAAIRLDKRPEVRQRCTAIRLLHLGHRPPEVARMQVVSIPTLYGWIDRWWEGGVKGLANKPKSGRLTKADDAYTCLLGKGDCQRTGGPGIQLGHLDIGSLASPYGKDDRD